MVTTHDYPLFELALTQPSLKYISNSYLPFDITLNAIQYVVFKFLTT